MITPEEASRIIRMFLLVTASAVPMAKWIGDKLNNPYNVKFQNWQLGIPFHKEIIGGLDAPEGRAWPRAAWNVLPSSRAGPELEHMVWNGRHALRDGSALKILPSSPRRTPQFSHLWMSAKMNFNNLMSKGMGARTMTSRVLALQLGPSFLVAYHQQKMRK